MALHYELEVFEELISDHLHPKNLINDKSTVASKQVSAWLSKALSEKEKIRKRFKPVTYSFLKEKHRKLYIQQHQSGLIRLLDTMLNYLSPKDIGSITENKQDSPVEKLYKRLFLYCLELLHYLQDSFPIIIFRAASTDLPPIVSFTVIFPPRQSISSEIFPFINSLPIVPFTFPFIFPFIVISPPLASSPPIVIFFSIITLPPVMTTSPLTSLLMCISPPADRISSPTKPLNVTIPPASNISFATVSLMIIGLRQ